MTPPADPPVRVPAPRLGAATRSAASDFFYNSWRLIPANLIWGAGLLALIVLWEAGAPLISILAAPLMALPTIGLYRLGTLVARGESVSFSDGLDAWRRFGRRALALGLVFTALATMFGVNVLLGVTNGDLLGWALATTATWGLIITVLCACVVWPLAADPWRQDMRLREIVRLAVLMVIAFPLRMGSLAGVVGIVLIASTFGFVALLTISIAFVALLSARFVLPAADRFSPLPPRDQV